MTGFEPATPRTPCVCATELRYIPLFKFIINSYINKSQLLKTKKKLTLLQHFI